MFSKVVTAAVLAAGILVPGVAAAATNAIVTTDLNMRAGPSAAYPRLATIPNGRNVKVYGCVKGYRWCDISWAGMRGWVSADYLAYVHSGYRRSIASIGFSIGLPVVVFDRDDYYRRHHHAWRHWDGRHDKRHERRDHRPEHRAEHRELRKEQRDVREARREVQQSKRKLLQEKRELHRTKRH